jgi:hypothetical protein
MLTYVFLVTVQLAAQFKIRLGGRHLNAKKYRSKPSLMGRSTVSSDPNGANACNTPV